MVGHLFEYFGRNLEWPRDRAFFPLSEDLVDKDEVVGWTRGTLDRFVRL